jgi:hypothetical protein
MEPIIGSAMITLLGSTVLRLIISSVLDRWKESRDHRYEVARVRLQDELAQKEHDRNLQALRVQKDLGILTAKLEKQFELDKAEEERFQAEVEELRRPTGVVWLDRWNSGIRPALATACIAVWLVSLHMRGWIPNSWDLELLSSTLGLFIGGRITATGK